MFVHSINIRKFRHLENITIGPLREDSTTSSIFALAGPNGSGKSSILELIGYALSSSYSLGWSLSRTFTGFSFEVGIGITDAERILIFEKIEAALLPIQAAIDDAVISIREDAAIHEAYKEDAIRRVVERMRPAQKQLIEIKEYLGENKVYYRAFSVEDGEYAKNPSLHNQIHHYVSSELKDASKRSLGFFLRADRNYPQKTFDRNKIFTFEKVLKREHLWSIAFNTSEIQYQDMYEYLVQQRYHFLRELGQYHNAIAKGHAPTSLPLDPLIPYEDLLNKVFPNYEFVNKDEAIPTNLFVKIPSGDIITFNDLSSGEKEVFFILSFFVRHNVENAIIVIDEPELHLHPELARILIANMRTIRNGNQIWLATHNSEIIDEAGRDMTMYFHRDQQSQSVRFVPASDEPKAQLMLKEMFGFSGFIGVAKNLIFLEGDNASIDRKIYAMLFPEISSSIKIIPANTCENQSKISAAILSIIESGLGWLNFSLIRDRDYLTPDMIAKYEGHPSGKIFVLQKHEIENYLLDSRVIQIVLSEIFNIERTPEQIERKLFQCAIKMSASVVRDMVSFRLNLLIRPQDFSMGRILQGESFFDLNGTEYSPNAEHESVIKSRLSSTGQNILANFSSSLAGEKIEEVFNDCVSEVQSAISSGNWRAIFPGKELLESFGKAEGITNIISFQNSLIKEFASKPHFIDAGLIHVFRKACN